MAGALSADPEHRRCQFPEVCNCFSKVRCCPSAVRKRAQTRGARVRHERNSKAGAATCRTRREEVFSLRDACLGDSLELPAFEEPASSKFEVRSGEMIEMELLISQSELRLR